MCAGVGCWLGLDYRVGRARWHTHTHIRKKSPRTAIERDGPAEEEEGDRRQRVKARVGERRLDGGHERGRLLSVRSRDMCVLIDRPTPFIPRRPIHPARTDTLVRIETNVRIYMLTSRVDAFRSSTSTSPGAGALAAPFSPPPAPPPPTDEERDASVAGGGFVNKGEKGIHTPHHE